MKRLGWFNQRTTDSTKLNKLNGKKEITYKELITNFINKKKNPHFSHYNRENIPNRRYIDNTNCVELYLEFAKKNNFRPFFKNFWKWK
jgi:hypothetical protein